ncbi:MAG TPA: 8-amino-7-oxononanoate synthase [Limnochordia bacterium]
MTEDPLGWVGPALASLAAAGLERRLVEASGAEQPWLELDGRRLLNLASNNYLGLAGSPALRRAAISAIERYGCGGTASRLIVGNHPLYAALEQELAAFKGTEAALVFGSGYAANVGVIPALVGRDDLVLSDRANHASLIDGIRLSGAVHRRYRHADPEHLRFLLDRWRGEHRRALIVTDTVFSMDGDFAPLEEIARLKRAYGAMWMVDEAHATGVFGPRGEGLAHELGIAEAVDVHMGTLSKACGGVGGYVAGRRELIQYLLQRARSLIYSTALPPADVAVARAAIDAVRLADRERRHLNQISERFRTELAAAGLAVGSSQSQIVPVMAGDNESAVRFAAAVRRRGIAAVAIRPPTVPEGTARVRFSLTAAHSEEEIGWATAGIISAAREVGLIEGASPR